LEVISTKMANSVTSAQGDLWEKERSAKRANGKLENLKVKADKSAADAMTLRATYPDNME
jgi:hypothetical protein